MAEVTISDMEAIANRVEYLVGTAEYLDVLVNLAADHVHDARKALTIYPTPMAAADAPEWRIAEVLLNLLADQIAIVTETVTAFEVARSSRKAAPPMLRGASAIAEYIASSAAHVSHLHNRHRLPTILLDGAPCATPAALDDWLALANAKAVPVT